MATQIVPDSKIAIVTGAGSGIGRAVALGLQGAGYAVVLAGRRQAALEETAGLAMAGGGQTLVVSCDVTQADAVTTLFARTREHFGRLDLLFNNAGMGAPAVAFEDLTLEQWQRVVDVNLTGSFLCAREAFRLMKQQQPQGGRIINNGSIAATTPRPQMIAYTATKHAITGLTKAAGLDGRAFDIAVCQIDIGNAQTNLSKAQSSGVIQADGSMKVEAMMDVDHVGEAVAYMDSLPLEANVPFMTIMATKMPFLGRG